MQKVLAVVTEVLTLLLALFSMCVLAFPGIAQWLIIVSVVFEAYSLLNLIHAWWSVSHTCPGFVPQDPTVIERLPDSERLSLYRMGILCQHCGIRPPLAHHCHVQNRCCREFDHWCPWAQATIAEQTKPYFLKFTLWAFMASIPPIVCTAVALINKTYASLLSIGRQNQGIAAFAIMLLPLVFGLFGAIMFTMHAFMALKFEQTGSRLFGDEKKSRLSAANFRYVAGDHCAAMLLLPFKNAVVRRDEVPPAI